MTDETCTSLDSAECCLNCGLELRGRYCHGCSQDREVGNPSLIKWVGETFAEFTSIEGRSLQSIRTLLARPGVLTVAWREGRRVGYTGPLRLFLFSLLLLLLVRSLLGSEPGFMLSAVLGFLEGAGATVDKTALLAQTDRILRAFTLLLAPVIAGLVSVFFRGRTFSEHFVFTIHVVGFALFLRTIFSFVELVVTSEYITEPIQVFGILIYAYLAMHRVYGESAQRTALKFVAISGLSIVIWFMAGLVILAGIVYSV